MGKGRERENCIKYTKREMNFGKIKKGTYRLLSKQQR
jgi:hypothetical protein